MPVESGESKTAPLKVDATRKEVRKVDERLEEMGEAYPGFGGEKILREKKLLQEARAIEDEGRELLKKQLARVGSPLKVDEVVPQVSEITVRQRRLNYAMLTNSKDVHLRRLNPAGEGGDG